MTDVQMINEMAEMQKELNKVIFTKSKECPHPMETYDTNRIMLALIDEIGELVHELKGDWCWWKKTQPQVNQERVLEELVDVWHFALSMNIYFDKKCKVVDFPSETLNRNLYSYICDVIMFGGTYNTMIELTFKLGFTIEEVYYSYIEKNQENYNRIKEGY